MRPLYLLKKLLRVREKISKKPCVIIGKNKDLEQKASLSPLPVREEFFVFRQVSREFDRKAVR